MALFIHVIRAYEDLVQEKYLYYMSVNIVSSLGK